MTASFCTVCGLTADLDVLDEHADTHDPKVRGQEIASAAVRRAMVLVRQHGVRAAA